ncbi:hypothetical protein BaRGS_00004413 [Batillaria attramentaria]|uniref:Uncharacterized protein n=1 Tax=Batillaria attramentaria TaxID=370345 RepID=A0ABD0LWU3_9CAEN
MARRERMRKEILLTRAKDKRLKRNIPWSNSSEVTVSLENFQQLARGKRLTYVSEITVEITAELSTRVIISLSDIPPVKQNAQCLCRHTQSQRPDVNSLCSAPVWSPVDEAGGFDSP